MKKNEKITTAVLVIVLCVIILGATGALVFLSSGMNPKIEESEQKVQQLQERADTAKQELEEIRAEADILNKKKSDASKAESEETADADSADQETEAEVESNANTDGGELSLEELETDNGGEAEINVSSIKDLQPGLIIPAEEISPFGIDKYFQDYEITEEDDIYARILGKSYHVNENVSLSDLRYMKVIHYNFDNEIQVGELIVAADLAEDFRSAFQQLFTCGYQIKSMYLVDNYWTGDPGSTDSASIEVNNTSAFNYREVTGGGGLSKHAFGCAIDINPQQNPYVTYGEDGSPRCTHQNAYEYLDRTTGAAHMITHEDECYKIFTSLGFIWGGDWHYPKDYQHFEKEV